jgi:hypothetical protein
MLSIIWFITLTILGYTIAIFGIITDDSGTDQGLTIFIGLFLNIATLAINHDYLFEKQLIPFLKLTLPQKGFFVYDLTLFVIPTLIYLAWFFLPLIIGVIIAIRIDKKKMKNIKKNSKTKKLAKLLGGKVITINPAEYGVINPFLIATENALTIDEKETELRKFFDLLSDYGAEYARQRLSDMSFLDDEPEWKERATLILKKYAKI